MSIYQSTPRWYFDGIDDQSTVALEASVLEQPQHFPIFMVQAQKGRTIPTLVGDTAVSSLYGTLTLDEKSKYYSHQSLALQTCLGAGNMCYVARQVSPDAKKASMVLKAEVVKTTFDSYVYNEDGSISTDVNGTKETDADTQVAGYSIHWSISPVVDSFAAVKSTGSLVGDAGETSTIFPILEFEADSEGEHGNNTAISLSFPNTTFEAPGNADIIEQANTLLYRFAIMQRESERKSPTVLESELGERYVDISLESEIYDEDTGASYSPDVLMDNWNSSAAGYAPVINPIGKMKIYQEYLEEMLTLLVEAETADTTVETTFDSLYMFNPFTCTSYDAVDYNTLRVAAPLSGKSSHTFSSLTPMYLVGGNDGLVGEDVLDELTSSFVTSNWDNLDAPLRDRLRFPFGEMYDTGFSVDTKKAIISATGQCPDLRVTCGTFEHGDVPGSKSLAEQLALSTLLQQHARLTPESTVFGTDQCRVVITRGLGLSAVTVRKRYVSLVMDLLYKRAQYAGAGTGKMNSSLRYDNAPTNRISQLTTYDFPYAKAATQDLFQEKGCNWVQYGDREQLFWPQYQTPYQPTNSVLTSEIVVGILCDVQRMCNTTWALTTGQGDKTNAQYFELVEETFNNLVDGRYDGRVDIIATAYQTTADNARGYSTSLKVEVAASFDRKVLSYQIVSQRRD
jgi:hypothetical protein